MSVLIENVTHHMEEEEWFPKDHTALGRTKLQERGACMVALGEDGHPLSVSTECVELKRVR